MRRGTLRSLRAVHLEGLVHGIAMPFNALASTLLLDAWGEKPEAG